MYCSDYILYTSCLYLILLIPVTCPSVTLGRTCKWRQPSICHSCGHPWHSCRLQTHSSPEPQRRAQSTQCDTWQVGLGPKALVLFKETNLLHACQLKKKLFVILLLNALLNCLLYVRLWKEAELEWHGFIANSSFKEEPQHLSINVQSCIVQTCNIRPTLSNPAFPALCFCVISHCPLLSPAF